jgi:7-methyl-GTP pyrophosphatase
MISSMKKTCQNKVMPATRRLVLASTSRYRRELLQRLGLPFECSSPGVDESVLEGELPARAAERLSAAKARAVADRFPDALIIGSDQVAYCGDLRLDKPHTHENAVRQLVAVSGQRASFDTAVALLDAATGVLQLRVVPTEVKFRILSPATIEKYLRREQPYDCAGSAKAEGLGIALIERIDSPDPTALLGLPLIALTGLLASAGLPVLPH